MKKYKSFIFDDIKINFFQYIKYCKIITNNELIL